jgi:hypothetical protein
MEGEWDGGMLDYLYGIECLLRSWRGPENKSSKPQGAEL